MIEKRIFNFSAGPSMLPEEVLRKAQSQMLNYNGSGMSVMEMSHRSSLYHEIITNVEVCLRAMLSIPKNYKVLLLQGGATSQFSMVPLNLMRTKRADYVVTGYFSKKAYAEAKKYGTITLVGTSEDKEYVYIPKQDALKLTNTADYLYYCTNNTIYGTQWNYVPKTNGSVLVADMSSDLLSKPIDVSKYGVIFAGAQKNMGCAGLTVVIVREDLIGYARDITPIMMDYAPLTKKHSMYNTPPTYAIYILGLVLEWIEEVGGLKAIAKHNQRKAQMLYTYIDTSKFYMTNVHKEDRSFMNVTFRTPSVELDEIFVKESANMGICNLKGHRFVGGIRASIYNAMPEEGIHALLAFMMVFEKEHAKYKME